MSTPPGKILIFNPFGIGDVLFTTPLVRNLKDNFPQSPIHYICNRRVYPLLKHNQLLAEVLVFEKDEWRALARESKLLFLARLFAFYHQIKRERFGVIFDFSLNSQYGFFFKAAGIKKRLGPNFKKRGRFLTHKVDIPAGYKDKHVARYYLEPLKFLSVEPRDCGFDLFLPADLEQRAKEILACYELEPGQPIVGVCPGSGDSWQSTAYFKRWPRRNFHKLCRLLQAELGAKIVLLGSKTESELCNKIYAGLEQKPVDLCGKLTLPEFCALLSLCRLVVTNDGGPLHIAQALNKKTIAFFGPVDERVYGPYPQNNNCRLFKKDIACRPCYKGFRFPGCVRDKECLREIEVEEVLAAAQELIGGKDESG